MQYAFIINYFADTKKRQKAEAEIETLSKRLPGQVFRHVTEHPGHAGELARMYADQFKEDGIVVALGGDGTVHEVSNALAFTKTPMAVVPLGTGNDFARSVLPAELFEHPEEIVRRLDTHRIRPIDMMRVTPFDKDGCPIPGSSSLSVNITSFGLDTAVQARAKEIVARARKSRWIRRNAYTLAIISCLLRGWNFKMRYTLRLFDGTEVSDRLSYCLACISNGRYYGNGFHPSPQGLTDDGILEATIVEDMPLYKVLPLVPKYKKGTHLGHPRIRSFQIVQCEIASDNPDTPLRGNYEGEDFEGASVQIEVVPGALSFAFFSI